MSAPAQDTPTRQSDSFGTVLINSFRLIGACWEALKLNLLTFIMVYILPIVILLAGLASLAGGSAFMLNAGEFDTTAAAPTMHWTPLLVSAALVGTFGVIALMILLSIAGIITQLASVRRIKISVKEALNQSFPYFWNVLVLGVLTLLAVILGLIAFIVPGIVAIFFLAFAIYILIDKQVTATDAIKESYELTKRNWKLVLAYFIVSIVLQIPSYMSKDIGQIITFVLTVVYICLPAFLYVRMQKQNPVAPTTAKPKK